MDMVYTQHVVTSGDMLMFWVITLCQVVGTQGVFQETNECYVIVSKEHLP